MTRPAGARNKDFSVKRQALLNKLTDFALNSDLRRPSLRQFASAAGASEPTLRNYFSDRKGLVLAILEEIGRRGSDIWQLAATPSKDISNAVEEYFRISEAGMLHGGFIRAHAFGIIEGVADLDVGAGYLMHVLNPALKAIEDKMRGTPGAAGGDQDLRSTAFAILSPMLVLSLHQNLLGGNQTAAIDVQDVLTRLQKLVVAGLSQADNFPH